jgi:DNA-binding response OmpR family regulator
MPTVTPLSSPPVQNNSARARVLLLVEDEQSLLRAFAHAFERSGFEVLQAIDVPSALMHWDRDADRIAIVVSDVQMPGPPIEELITAVRAREDLSPPILLMSGELRGTETRISSLMQSVNAFLPKPLRIDTLRAEVERHLSVLPPG